MAVGVDIMMIVWFYWWNRDKPDKKIIIYISSDDLAGWTGRFVVSKRERGLGESRGRKKKNAEHTTVGDDGDISSGFDQLQPLLLLLRNLSLLSSEKPLVSLPPLPDGLCFSHSVFKIRFLCCFWFKVALFMYMLGAKVWFFISGMIL